ncbi:MAG: hypothetical protein KF723_01600 [Rhizobiaceae bacterium]|nr:hypothetical protein [Rhizobiaceae bacterium]
MGHDSGRSERLFRAAVSAFCSLTRPTRREIAQLEDLVLPLFDSVSREALRFVAAALSESEFAPEGLVRKLADETVDVAAPLLLRSNALNDVDLIALIGRHGVPHARAIARRNELNPVIEDLIKALLESASRVEPAAVPVVQPAASPAASNNDASRDEAPRKTFGKADAVRDRLRAMMVPADEPEQFHAVLELAPILAPDELKRLRDTALTGNTAFFETALADALGLDYARARAIRSGSGYSDLIYALKSLEVEEDTAFVIVAANQPAQFGHAEAIRLFLERYRLCHPDAARDKLRAWKADAIADVVRKAKPKTAANLADVANGDRRPSILKAS